MWLKAYQSNILFYLNIDVISRMGKLLYLLSIPEIEDVELWTSKVEIAYLSTYLSTQVKFK